MFPSSAAPARTARRSPGASEAGWTSSPIASPVAAGAADSWFGGGGDDSRSLSSSHNAAQDAMDRLAFHAQVKGVSEAFGALGHDAAEDVGSLAHKAAELTAQFNALIDTRRSGCPWRLC